MSKPVTPFREHQQRWITIGTISAATIGIDQFSKSLAITSLKGKPGASYAGDLFRLQYSENPGAFLSLGASLSADARFWLLNVAVGLGLVGCLVYLVRAKKILPIHLWGFSLLMSGGLSNLFDRVLRTGGGVVDFMNVGIGSLRTGIFNIADMAIMAGVILVAWPPGSSAKAKNSSPS